MKYRIKPILFVALFLITSKAFSMEDRRTGAAGAQEEQIKNDARALKAALERQPSRLGNSVSFESAPDPVLDAINAMTPEERTAYLKNIDDFLARREKIETLASKNEDLVLQSEAFLDNSEKKPSKLPKITPARIALALGAAWAAIELKIAYKSFTAEEKARAGYKFPLLLGLRTGRNMLSRPGQIISLPAKAVVLLEKKGLGK